jgi:formylglycine-generating enzyme required for sulfatase activity
MAQKKSPLSPERRHLAQTSVGRCDLLYVLMQTWGPEHLEEVAACLGFEKSAREKAPKIRQRPQEVITEAPQADLPPETPPRPFHEARYWLAGAYRPKKRKETLMKIPQWLEERRATGPKPSDRPAKRIGAKQPLIPWSRLWPFLQKALSVSFQVQQLDMDRLIDRIAQMQPLTTLPYQEVRSWARPVEIVIDHSQALLPFWDDAFALGHTLREMCGRRTGLRVQLMDNGPDGRFSIWQSRAPGGPFRLPEPGAPLLIISDCGAHDGPNGPATAWLHFGKQLRRAGVLPTVLMLASPRQWPAELAHIFRMVCWDRGYRLPRLDHPDSHGLSPVPGVTKRDANAVERLLTLLSPAVVIEHALLRAMRLWHGGPDADIGTEVAAWRSEAVSRHPLGFMFRKESVAKYQERFQAQPLELRKSALALIAQYHQQLPEGVWLEYNISPAEFIHDPQALQLVQDGFAKKFWEWESSSKADRESIAAWIKRLAGRQWEQIALPEYEALAALWLAINLPDIKQGNVELPPGLDIHRYPWLFGEIPHLSIWHIRQQGESLVFAPAHGGDARAVQPYSPGSPVAWLNMAQTIIEVQHRVEKNSISFTGDIQNRLTQEICLPEKGDITLSTDLEDLTLTQISKPAWAKEIGRDRFGLYIEFEVKGIRQRMRWINPGKLLMGSPENEPERSRDERQHEVILTCGFWLADTVCTQELWQAVMGDNPSRFKGSQRPVERVNWEDCQKFLATINSLVPELDLVLPSEAQWEYACRAGTTTPFAFGTTITLAQVYYAGRFYYDGTKRGVYHQDTEVVKSLPPNPWGLYEMHGNVWEWCSDWYGEYPSDSVSDPVGPGTGSSRVLRGGSRIEISHDCRSAYRKKVDPNFCNDYIGFRFSRGHKEPGK